MSVSLQINTFPPVHLLRFVITLRFTYLWEYNIGIL